MRYFLHRHSRLGLRLALVLAAAAAGCRSYHGYQPETQIPPDHGSVPETTRPNTSSPPGYPGSR